MNIIENLLNIMDQKGITAYKINKDIGIKPSTFTAWKNGSQPTIDKIIRIVQYLEITPNELFGYTENKPDLTENEKEMLELFQKLSDREQIKEIGRLEDRVKQLNEMEGSSNSENDKAG